MSRIRKDLESYCKETHNEILLEEWDYEANYPQKPSNVSYGSKMRAYWKCSKCGNRWAAVISSRSTAGNGCSVCGHKATVKTRIINALANHNLLIDCPDLVKEWDYKKNYPKRPDDYLKGSHESVYWVCPKGHPSYLARIANRTYKGDGCPICGGRKLLVGFNDLGTVYPALAAQWDYEKNWPKTPQDVFSREGKAYWWICPICNESYYASLANRSAGKNHKKCSQKGTSFPEQATYFYVKQLFPDAKNRDTSLGFEMDIFIPSRKIAVEFDGVRFHQSSSSVTKDNNKDKLCCDLGITLYRLRDPSLPNTVCARRVNCIDDGRKVKLNEPIKELLGLLVPENDITVDVIRDYYTILSTSLISLKQKSIVVTHPSIAAEWHTSFNLPLTPDKVTSGMRVSVWWKCSICGESYQSVMYSRKAGRGCPKCAKKLMGLAKTAAAIRTNSLLEKYPQLIEEISLEDNPGIDISRLVAGSKQHIVWHCQKCGFKWSAAINHRTNGVGCPRCGREKTITAAKRAVVNLDTGEVFESLKEAAVACGGDKRGISNCCRGLSKTAYGYHWQYRDESKARKRQTRMLIRNVETGEVFQTIQQAADKYGCDRSAISAALRGKTKLSQGCHWEFIQSTASD